MELDSIVCSVIQKFTDRARLGKKKYGTDLDRTDLITLDWVQHTQEELMDAILYLEKLKSSLVSNQEKRLAPVSQEESNHPSESQNQDAQKELDHPLPS